MWNRKGGGSRQDPLHETTDGNQVSLGHCGCTLRAAEHTPPLPFKGPCSLYTIGFLSSFKPQLRDHLLLATQRIISNRSLLRSTLRASCTLIILCNNRLAHLDYFYFITRPEIPGRQGPGVCMPGAEGTLSNGKWTQRQCSTSQETSGAGERKEHGELLTADWWASLRHSFTF